MICAKHGFNILPKDIRTLDEAKIYQRLLRVAQSSVSQEGLIAFVTLMKEAMGRSETREVAVAILREVASILSELKISEGSDNLEDELIQRVCTDLHLTIYVKQIWERMLTYAMHKTNAVIGVLEEREGI